jgi:spermidine/putrescine-binding protein
MRTKSKKTKNAMKRTNSLVVAVGLALAAVMGAYAEAKKEKVNLPDLPEAVQKTVTDHSKGGTLDKIEKETDNGKFVCYTIAVKKGDKTEEFHVAEDGKYLGKEKPKKE